MENNYKKLAMAIAINTVVMFFLTYTMIAESSHFYANLNRIYMALLMACLMVLVMLFVMRAMYPNQKLNLALSGLVTALFVLIFWLARTQTPIGNDQFLRSMIPHHSSAILMCQQAKLTDPEILKLCEQIVKAQKDEIEQMKAILARPH